MKKLIVNKVKYFILSLTFILLPLTAHAGDLDGSKTLLCSVNSATECTPADGCERVNPEIINAPQFLKIDFEKKIITAIPEGTGKRSTEIENKEFIDGKLILQGAEDGFKRYQDGLGWSMAITEDTGKMVLTGSGNQVGFVIFGACTAI